MNVKKLAGKLKYPVIIVGLIIYFIAAPIYSLGLQKWLGVEYFNNPFSKRIVSRFLNYKAAKLSKEWYDRVTIITPPKSQT